MKIIHPDVKEFNMSKKIDYAKKYWWLTLIVVPIAVALIGQLSGVIDLFKPPPPPAGNYTTNNMYLITQVFNTGEATQDVQQRVDTAISLTQSGNYADAISLLETVVARYELAAIYNDLGVLYALSGDSQKAQEAFQKALQEEANNQAVNLNLGRLAESLGNTEEAKQYFSKAPDLYTPPPTPDSNSMRVNTQIPGVTAELIEFSRFQNTITLKIRLSNSSANDALFICDITGGHLLDEATNKMYEISDQSNGGCSLSVSANSNVDVWVKYSVPIEDKPQFLTAVLGYGIIFEHLAIR